MTRALIAALILVCVGWALGATLQHRRSGDQTRPPAPDDKAAWEWVGAERGANIYVSPVAPREPDSPASAWINREFSPGAASVGGSLMELQQFDCRRRTIRRLSSARPYRDLNGAAQLQMTADASGWQAVTPGTAAERVMFAVCANRTQRTLGTQNP